MVVMVMLPSPGLGFLEASEETVLAPGACCAPPAPNTLPHVFPSSMYS